MRCVSICWPLITIVLIIAVHHRLTFYFPAMLVHSISSLTAQTVLAFYLIYSLNSNLKALDNRDLLDILKSVFSKFPLHNKGKKLSIELKAHEASSGASISVDPEYKFNDIETLTKHVNELRRKLSKEIELVSQQVAQNHRELDKKLIEIKTDFETTHLNIKSSIATTIIGNPQTQIFMALIALYGAVSGFLATN